MEKSWYKKGEALLEEMQQTRTGSPEVTMALWYLGQSGFAMKTGQSGCQTWMDPILADITDEMGNTRKYYPAPFSPRLAKADYVICTHGHIDHMNPETLKGLAAGNPQAVFVIPGACYEEVLSMGIPEENIRQINEGEVLELGGLTIQAISAAHPRHEKDEQGRSKALCYYVESNGISLLHLGDTYLTEQLLSDLEKLPPPDIFIVPINGGDLFRTRNHCIGNLNMTEAAKLARFIKADLTIPAHYDMIYGNTADPLEFVRILRCLDSSARVSLPSLGERMILSKLR